MLIVSEFQREMQLNGDAAELLRLACSESPPWLINYGELQRWLTDDQGAYADLIELAIAKQDCVDLDWVWDAVSKSEYGSFQVLDRFILQAGLPAAKYYRKYFDGLVEMVGRVHSSFFYPWQLEVALQMVKTDPTNLASYAYNALWGLWRHGTPSSYVRAQIAETMVELCMIDAQVDRETHSVLDLTFRMQDGYQLTHMYMKSGDPEAIAIAQDHLLHPNGDTPILNMRDVQNVIGVRNVSIDGLIDFILGHPKISSRDFVASCALPYLSKMVENFSHINTIDLQYRLIGLPHEAFMLSSFTCSLMGSNMPHELGVVLDSLKASPGRNKEAVLSLAREMMLATTRNPKKYALSSWQAMDRLLHRQGVTAGFAQDFALAFVDRFGTREARSPIAKSFVESAPHFIFYAESAKPRVLANRSDAIIVTDLQMAKLEAMATDELTDECASQNKPWWINPNLIQAWIETHGSLSDQIEYIRRVDDAGLKKVLQAGLAGWLYNDQIFQAVDLMIRKKCLQVSEATRWGYKSVKARMDSDLIRPFDETSDTKSTSSPGLDEKVLHALSMLVDFALMPGADITIEVQTELHAWMENWNSTRYMSELPSLLERLCAASPKADIDAALRMVIHYVGTIQDPYKRIDYVESVLMDFVSSVPRSNVRLCQKSAWEMMPFGSKNETSIMAANGPYQHFRSWINRAPYAVKKQIDLYEVIEYFLSCLDLRTTGKASGDVADEMNRLLHIEGVTPEMVYSVSVRLGASPHVLTHMTLKQITQYPSSALAMESVRKLIEATSQETAEWDFILLNAVRLMSASVLSFSSQMTHSVNNALAELPLDQEQRNRLLKSSVASITSQYERGLGLRL